MKLTLGFSTCPNDTFIFDALVHGKIDTEGLSFEVVMADVEELNRRAFLNALDVTKLSYHACALVAGRYSLLHAGSALGRGNGPLLISRHPLRPEEIRGGKIAIPGRYTTANLLFSLFYPEALRKTEMIFSDIEDALLSGVADAGVIIHENRFTYGQRGLVKIADLGEQWEKQTELPIPLGGIVASNSLPLEVRQTMNRVMHRSVAFAMAHPASSAEFVKAHARELDNEVIASHISLYVNDFTLDLGEEGIRAVTRLFNEASAKGIINPIPGNLFLEI